MVCLINNDLIPKVHPLAVPIFHVHLNHFANIKIPWRSNYMESLGLHFQQLLKKPENNHLWFSGSTGSQENSRVDAGGVGSPYLRTNHPFPLFLSSSCEGGRGRQVTYVHLWMKPCHTMQWITDPYYLAKSPHIWHIACEVAKFAFDQEL